MYLRNLKQTTNKNTFDFFKRERKREQSNQIKNIDKKNSSKQQQ